MQPALGNAKRRKRVSLRGKPCLKLANNTNPIQCGANRIPQPSNFHVKHHLHGSSVCEREWSPESLLHGRSLLIPSQPHTLAGSSRSLPVVEAHPPSSSLELEVIPIGQGVHVNRCERNPSWPGSPLSHSPLPPTAPSPSSSSSSQGDCHMIAKKWHINEAPLQGSFLLLSPLKTIRWFEGGHGGSHLAQRCCGAHSSALRSPEAAATTFRAGTPQLSSAACGAHHQKALRRRAEELRLAEPSRDGTLRRDCGLGGTRGAAAPSRMRTLNLEQL